MILCLIPLPNGLKHKTTFPPYSKKDSTFITVLNQAPYFHPMLHRKKSTSQITRLPVQVAEGKTINMVIYRERRNNWRIAVGQQSVNLRIPAGALPPGKDPVEWGEAWIRETYQDKPSVFNHFFFEIPYDGKEYQTGFGSVRVKLAPWSRTNAVGSVEGDALEIKYATGWGDTEKAQVFPKLISKLMIDRYRMDFERRVKEVNDTCLNFDYHSVTFRYNKSNWGSCSTDGRLTFSTRLFLAPKPVIDYVIVHELAHLKVHNHSKAFWNIVQQVMPSYKEKVRWLRERGQELYF